MWTLDILPLNLMMFMVSMMLLGSLGILELIFNRDFRIWNEWNLVHHWDQPWRAGSRHPELAGRSPHPGTTLGVV